MKNEKVIVMGPQDVAAMRSAAKDAEVAYFNAKVGALEFVAEEMRGTGEEYTAFELSAMSGLTSGEIAAQLGRSWCRASQQAGIHDNGGVRSGVRFVEQTYVRLMPDGSIDTDHQMRVTRKQAVYQMRSNNRR
jgi:hypothetical protein